LLNQARRSAIGGVKVDVKVLRKEQQRLLESESKSSNADENVQQVTEETDNDDQDLEDFDSVAKELKEELARAREMEEIDFLKCFASFQISDNRKHAS
jgi:predicted RNase H-like nuclease (RuvC/YqgF family)